MKETHIASAGNTSSPIEEQLLDKWSVAMPCEYSTSLTRGSTEIVTSEKHLLMMNFHGWEVARHTRKE